MFEGLKAWLSNPAGMSKKALVNNLTAELPTGCGDQAHEQHYTKGFIGNRYVKELILSLEKYDKDVEAKITSGSHARDKGAVSFNKKAIELLKLYRKELENFKKFDFFASSTLKRLKHSKEKMHEILKQLETKSTSALQHYSDDPIREAAKKNKVLEGFPIPPRIWCDFMDDMIKDIQTTLSEFDAVIDLDKPDINFEKLQIKPEKSGVGKEDIERKKTLESNITAKLKKDAEAAKKKVDGEFTEATKIHNKIKTFYDSSVAKRKGIKPNIHNNSELEDTQRQLQIFNNNFLVPICRLVGLTCCKYTVGEGLSEAEQRELDKGYGDGIKKLKEDMETYMSDAQKKYSEALKLAPEVHKKSDEIKKYEKASQISMKKIQGLFAKIAKTKAVPIEE